MINRHTTPEGIYWVPGNRIEYVDSRFAKDGWVHVSGHTTVAALRALERRGLIVQPAGANRVHRYAYASTETGRAALAEHFKTT